MMDFSAAVAKTDRRATHAQPEISVIVPIYNEVDNIALLHDRVSSALEQLGRSWELVLVNDGSTDASPVLLDQIAAKDARVTVVHFRRNYGQTAAFMAGIDHAAGTIIVPMDGDLQNDPNDIAKLLGKLDEGFDVVSGWRKDQGQSGKTEPAEPTCQRADFARIRRSPA